MIVIIMHEMSIALSILDIASEESQRRNGVIVRGIYVRLGSFSGVVREALTSAFELARETSPFGDCRLIIEEVPATVYCEVCQSEQPVDSIQLLCCARCGTLSGNIVRGRELEITAMEIDEPVRGTQAPALLREE